MTELMHPSNNERIFHNSYTFEILFQ
ncbi:hypothetical protein MASSI9I_80014 [Massilia sp. 9I]|nr:hypothetical protein MASSI9I_80014 [Massilia sp. 9I]